MKSSDKIPIKKICEQLGEDIETPLCEEINEYIKNNPGCKTYLECIKKIVNYCRITADTDKIPDDVIKRLQKKINR